jgi:hypothetical protein
VAGRGGVAYSLPLLTFFGTWPSFVEQWSEAMRFHSTPVFCFPPAEPSRRAILLCPPGFSCRSMNKAMAHTSGARSRLIGRVTTCQVLPCEQSHPCLHRPLSAILQTQQGRPSLSTSSPLSAIKSQYPVPSPANPLKHVSYSQSHPP